jgi:hypothetical protein
MITFLTLTENLKSTGSFHIRKDGIAAMRKNSPGRKARTKLSIQRWRCTAPVAPTLV